MALSVILCALVAIKIVQIYGTALSNKECEVRARTEAGWVCGARRYDDNGGQYASFTNVPYAQQPLGELRFKELQPPQPWDYLYDATKLGPICPQYNFFYGPLMTNPNMSEACIHANIYVPLDALPSPNEPTQYGPKTETSSDGLPIIVFIHGGGFVCGSGDPDFHGPEYLVAQKMIPVTFNYRLNSLGFLSLNTPEIPGNNGLRDVVTFFRWLQTNAHYFGGNPDDITIAGQSAGGAIAHLMVLSRATTGLFRRAILMSGVASRNFYTASPKHAKELANILLFKLKITTNDPVEIHRQLIETPIEKLMNATTEIHMKNAPVSFSPVVEEHFPGITTVLDEDPECLILGGRGNHIPLLVGFTKLEGKFFLKNFEESTILERVKENPDVTLSPDLKYKLPERTAYLLGKMTADRYLGNDPTADKFSKCFADYGFAYPALKFTQQRAQTRSAPTYLYQFSYNASFSIIKYTKHINYYGATHCEDIPTIFKTNALKSVQAVEHPTRNDFEIRQYMIKILKNFIKYNAPVPISNEKTGGPWPAQSRNTTIKYKNVFMPSNILYSDLTEEQIEMFHYYENLYKYAENKCSKTSADVI